MGVSRVLSAAAVDGVPSEGSSPAPEMGELLERIYHLLLARFGPQGWWPADGDFEMAVGAILTQSTAWVNVERAIANLKENGLLDAAALMRIPESRLAELVKPSGYFNQKARKVKAFVRDLEARHRGDLGALFHVKLPELRMELLSIWGIGPETADSIILYGARRPIFVIDAYTRRILGRLGLSAPDATYDELQRLFMDHLPPSVPLYQEYHALLVALGKEVCRPTPLCPRCPLRETCALALRST